MAITVKKKPVKKTAPAKDAAPAKSKGLSYLKKGAAAVTEVAKAEAQAELRKTNNTWRFWLPDGEDAKITFLDGGLLADGTIDSVVYHEHNVKMNGRFGNTFLCIKEFEACPLCEQDDNAAFVAAFTIIDHRKYTDKDKKEHKDQTRLFVCKLETYKLLQKIATKRDGLAGATFDVSRTGDKSASVGNMFDYTSKAPVGAILKKYDTAVIDYEKEIPYRDGKTLRDLGFGVDTSGAYDMPDDDDNVEEDDEL